MRHTSMPEMAKNPPGRNSRMLNTVMNHYSSKKPEIQLPPIGGFDDKLYESLNISTTYNTSAIFPSPVTTNREIMIPKKTLNRIYLNKHNLGGVPDNTSDYLS